MIAGRARQAGTTQSEAGCEKQVLVPVFQRVEELEHRLTDCLVSIHAHQCSPCRGSRRSLASGQLGGRRRSSSLAAAAACSSLPSESDDDGLSRRAAEAEEARVVEAAARRSRAVVRGGMTWKRSTRG